MGYLAKELLPKSQTKSDDIGSGEVSLKHLAPALFLELQAIKLHTHSGIDSQLLQPGATPEVVKGYTPLEREEHGVAAWTGSASASGSIALTFGTPFIGVPDVFCVAQSGDANFIIGTSTPTATGVTIYWRDATTSTHTAVNICWLAKGR